MNLILIQSKEVDAGGRAVLTDARGRHIRSVLKAVPGQSVRIGLLNGPLGTGRVELLDSSSVVLSCSFGVAVPPVPKIDLILAMPRPKVLKRLWAQLAALGVGRIVLLRADKVERFYFDSHVVDPEFYTPLLMEGLQQARCTHLPDVMVRPRFKPFVEDELDALFATHVKVLADPSGDKRLLDFFKDSPPAGRVVLGIGPEGGWTPYELDMLEARGFERFSMGSRILRTDTASVGLISLLMQVMD